jgi:hypothetical protein
VREIRKKNASVHQTAIITTNYSLPIPKIALLMFARWCQENFFKYIVESFGIDSITNYLKNKLPDTSMIVNPEYKALDDDLKDNDFSLKSRTLNLYASVSGGKDSGVMLDIIRRYVDKSVPAVFCNTGNDF